MKPILRHSLIMTAAMTSLAILSVQPAAAALAYQVTVNTSAPTVNGTTGALDFAFNPGNATSQPATAQVLNFTGGTLGTAPATNLAACFATPTTTCGAVTGTLPSVTFMNTDANNEYLQDFTYGPSFSFLLLLSGPAITSPNGTSTAGTTFCLGLYSDAAGTVPIPNQTPAGCNGEIDINLNGSTTITTPGGGTVTVMITAVAVPGADNYQIGFAANLNIGDSVVNISNSGSQGGPFTGATTGNICVNVYAFDPSEEQIACCACLVTPNGLYSLSAQHDLINNVLTPAVPNSISISLLASQPGRDITGAFTVCNPASVVGGTANVPYIPGGTGSLAAGLTAWGTTLEPAGSAATYGNVPVNFVQANLSPTELSSLTNVCAFIQSDGTNYGICQSCATGALGGTKK